MFITAKPKLHVKKLQSTLSIKILPEIEHLKFDLMVMPVIRVFIAGGQAQNIPVRGHPQT